MKDFVVSARKYRPQTFESVVGQKSITETLKSAIKTKQLAQAFLFTGPRGVGKTTCARILAKTINCLNLNENIEPCNACASCEEFNASASFNIHELDAASNNSVDDIRSLVEQVRVPPQAVQYKVYIIDEVHMLSQQAFNAFLKTLEEPPAYAKFILATTEKHKIIPTILSRCQIYDFNRIKVEDIEAHLVQIAQKEGVTAEQEALFVIAQKADGSLRDALSIFDQIVTYSGKHVSYEKTIENLNVVDVNTYFNITHLILEKNIHGLLSDLNEILESGHDLSHFMMGLGSHFRNLLMVKDAITVKLLDASKTMKDKYLSQASFCEPNFLINALDIINKCDLNYRMSGNKRLLVELSLMQIVGLLADVPSATIENIAKPVIEAPKENTKQEPPVVAVKPPEETKTADTKNKEEAPIITNTSISINPLPQEKKEYPKTDDVQAETIEEAVLNDDFTEEALIGAWQEFMDFLADDHLDLKSYLMVANPKKTDKSTFSIEVISDFHKQQFGKNKTICVGFLKKRLNVEQIEISVIVNKEDKIVADKPFTAKEKFDNMAEKNKALNHLRGKLNLELDF